MNDPGLDNVYKRLEDKKIDALTIEDLRTLGAYLTAVKKFEAATLVKSYAEKLAKAVNEVEDLRQQAFRTGLIGLFAAAEKAASHDVEQDAIDRALDKVTYVP